MATKQDLQGTTGRGRPTKVCFSFAAYAKSVISTLQSSDVHLTHGLSDAEISAVETAAGFTFPPDLRSILSEGLPVGPGFPNWRSSSRHQLRLLSSLPILSLAKEVSRNNFWAPSCWGPRPTDDDDTALSRAHTLLARAPPLVPIFKQCYVPSEPNLAGNPVFYVHGGEVRLLSVDVGGFFKETEFWRKDWVFPQPGKKSSESPAWAAARRIEFWTEASEQGGSTRRRWWSGRELGGCLEDVVWRLREGGWGEEDVREMMMMDLDEAATATGRRKLVVAGDREGVVRHVRSLSRELLRGGWSIDDVVYSLCGHGNGMIETGILDGEAWVDFDVSHPIPISPVMTK